MLQFLQIFPYRLAPARVAQDGTGVVGNKERNAEKLVLFGAEGPEGGLLVEEVLGGYSADCEDGARADDGNLFEQVGFAGGGLVGLRVAVTGGAALDDVCNEYVGLAG